MKSHRFKGSGPGFNCLYVAGTEEGSRRCDRMVDDPIHSDNPVIPQKAFPSGSGFAPAPDKPKFWPGSAEAVWQAHGKIVQELLATKQAYGDAWKEQGYMGNLARIFSKSARLKNMAWRDEAGSGDVPIGDESVLDSLRDLSALCAFAIHNIEEGNRWGS